MSLLILLLTLTVIFAFLHITYSFRKGRKSYLKCTLKGPPGLPIIGNGLPLLRSYRAPMRQYTQWAKKYGGLYKIQVGSQPAVVIGEVKSLQKIFSKLGSQFHYRPRGTVLSVVLGNKGLVTSDGPVWQQHRRFTVKALHELGAGRPVNENERLCRPLEKLIHRIKNGLDEKGFDPISEIGLCVFESMWNYFGTENVTEHEKEQVRKFLEESPPEMQVAEVGGVWNFSVPLQLMWIFRNNPIKLSISTVRKSIFIRNQIATETRIRNDYKAKHGATAPPRSLLSLYLDEILDAKEDRKFPKFSGVQLRTYLADLIAAGVDTTFTTLRWVLILLATHPEVMKKLTDELDDALKGKTFQEVTSYAFRHDLPYLESVILETLRFRPTIHTILHTTREDVHFDHEGQTICIPKDCWLIGNLWGVHFDEKLWKDPDEFNPDRFLDSNGKVRKEEADKCIPFSIGIRSCPGELLARVSLYAFLVGLLSQFSVKLADDDHYGDGCNDHQSPVSIEPIVGVSLIPPPKAKLTLTQRNKKMDLPEDNAES